MNYTFRGNYSICVPTDIIEKYRTVFKKDLSRITILGNIEQIYNTNVDIAFRQNTLEDIQNRVCKFINNATEIVEQFL